MKGTRSLWLSLTLVLLSGLAFADGLPPGDPAIEINDPVCDSATPCAPIVNALVPFTFSANAQGNSQTPPTSFEVNPASNGFFSLDVQTLGTFTSTDLVNCTSNEFQCDVTFVGGVTNLYFHEAVGCEFACGGFPPGDVFTITLLGWQPNQAFTAIANLDAPATTPFIPTPEPSMLLLFGLGAALTQLRQRVRPS